MNFTFLEVNSIDLLEKVFAFRYKVITESEIFDEYVRETEFSDNKESDIFDSYSVHFAAIDEYGEVFATVRLIHSCPHGYPTENCMKFDNDMFQRDKLGEMSRIFIDKKYRSIPATKVIIQYVKKFMYAKMMELGIEYTYGAIEPRFMRLLKMYKMCYEKLSELQMHGSMGLRYPCILYTKRLGDDNPEFVNAWKEENA